MSETASYVVYLFPQALEALGDAVKPYLLDGSSGAHFACAEIDTSGALFGMTLVGRDVRGVASELEILIPHAMVRLVMSVHSDQGFGFA